jgi:hypothetical protein
MLMVAGEDKITVDSLDVFQTLNLKPAEKLQ